MREVEEYLNAADAGLYTSESESFGLSILETLFHGKPVVAFRVGGIPEVVIDGECGFLHAFGEIDAVAKSLSLLANSPKLAREMGERGRRRAEAQLFRGSNCAALRIALSTRAPVDASLWEARGDGNAGLALRGAKRLQPAVALHEIGCLSDGR